MNSQIESGSKVFWKDPDNGILSGEYIVWDVTVDSETDELIYWIGDDTQVLLFELELIN